jgi:hypothetical protein
MERFQIGRSDTEVRSRLFRKPTHNLIRELSRVIEEVLGTGEVRYQVGNAAGQRASSAKTAAQAMAEAAAGIHTSTRIRTLRTGGAPSVRLWVLAGEIQDIFRIPIPAQAREVNGKAIDATRRYNEELSLVFPTYKTLGGYAPRPLKDQMPDGWAFGDRWPMFQGRLASASEHAWGNGVDVGKAGAGGAFDQGPALKPLLRSVTDYTIANRERLTLVDHIFDGFRFHQRDGFRKTPYTGSDKHSTHTHTAFGEHNGNKPPWL